MLNVFFLKRVISFRLDGIFSLLCMCFLSSCLSVGQHGAETDEFDTWIQEQNKIRVLSTVEMINDVVQRVGRDHVVALTLIKGSLDPHTYELVKGDGEKLDYADIIFWNGLELEHGPSLKHRLSMSGKAFALGDIIQKQEPNVVLNVDGRVDPHIWMDISIWMKTVPVIAEVLGEIDPENKEEYLKNAKEYVLEMKETHDEVLTLMKSVPSQRRYLVTSHDAFNYFARSYLADADEVSQKQWESRVIAPEGLAPEAQISTMDIQKTIDYLKAYKIDVIFPESNVSRDSIKKIVNAGREKGMDLIVADTALYGDAMGEAGSSGDTYLKMIKHNVVVISSYLNGDYREAQVQP